jgi:hypothetical protein
MLEGAKKKAAELKEGLEQGLGTSSKKAQEAIDDAGRRISTGAGTLKHRVTEDLENVKAGGVNLWATISKKPSGTLQQLMQNKPRINRHLVYNPQQMCTWEIFRSYHGTVLADEKIFRVAGGLMVVAASSVCLVFCFCPRPQDLKMSSFFSLVLYFKVFIAFMLGMYMSFCLKRWWMCMQTLTDFFLGIRKISYFCNSAGVPDEPLHAIQRLSMISAYLLENEVTSIFTTDTATREAKWATLVQHLREEGLIHDDELETLEKHVEHDSRALVVWTWVGCHIAALDLPAPLRGVLYELVTKQTDLVTQIKTFLIFQLPYMYSHMLACFVHLNNIMIAVACGVGIAVAIGDMVQGWSWWSKDRAGVAVPNSIHPRSQVYTGIQMVFVHMLVLFVQPLIYQAFLEIASMLCDPFTHVTYGVPIHDCIFETKRLIHDQNVFAKHDLDEIEKNHRKTHLKTVMRAAGKK